MRCGTLLLNLSFVMSCKDLEVLLSRIHDTSLDGLHDRTSEQFMNWVKDRQYLPSSPSPDPLVRVHTRGVNSPELLGCNVIWPIWWSLETDSNLSESFRIGGLARHLGYEAGWLDWETQKRDRDREREREREREQAGQALPQQATGWPQAVHHMDRTDQLCLIEIRRDTYLILSDTFLLWVFFS